MSAGSSNSNLDYANQNPYNMSHYVNGTSSNYSGNFSNSVISGTPPGPLPGLAGAKNNVDAAASIVPGICMNGGAKKLKRKIKNITKQYKRMKKGSKKTQKLKKRIRKSKYIARHIAGGSKKYQKHHLKQNRRSTKRNHKKSRKQKGGYAQYNTSPNTPTYQVAGIPLQAQNLNLANPSTFQVLDNCVNCVDNYNHYTNKGFSTTQN